MTKQLRIQAVVANSPYMTTPSGWTYPGDDTRNHSTLGFWKDLARLCERGKFDAIFIADTVGVFDLFKGGAEEAIRLGVRIPAYDPSVILPAMADITENIGFGVTQNTSFEHPYLLARRLATLDHYLDGRLAWNIVTGFQQSGARAMGMKAIADPAIRYGMLDEFMEVVYKLLEQGWENDAILKDIAHGIYADPSKVHKVVHKGEYYDIEGYSLVDASPQRTPVLFQAGASGPGRRFAARNAECVFMVDASHDALADQTADIRKQAREAGRDPRDVLAFAGYTIVVDETEEGAQAKYRDYMSRIKLDAALSFASGTTGVDLSQFEPDEPIPHVTTAGQIRSHIDSFSGANAGKKAWTPRELAMHMAVGGRAARFVGSAEQVADHLIKSAEEMDVDGFALSAASVPGDLEAFIELVVPILQERGAYKQDYAAGTFRKKLYGQDHLLDTHPGAGFRPGR